MLLNFIFILLFTGVMSFFASQQRVSPAWTLLLGGAFAYSILALMGITTSSDISVVWNAMPNLSIAVNLNPLQTSQTAALGIIIVCALSFYYNLLFFDNDKNALNGLVAIIGVLSIIALCSTNYLQLLASVGMADVMIYSVINRYEAKRQYIYGNFFADFLLLNILAIILGQHGNIDIMSLDKYETDWHHRDYIAIMLLICIFIKSGIVLFHTAYQKMSALSLNRLNFILFAATPLLGIIILNILHGILNISHYSFFLIKIFAVCTVLWGMAGALFVKGIKRKSAYMGMIFWGLSFCGFAWLPLFSQSTFFLFLVSALLFNVALALVKGNVPAFPCWKRCFHFRLIAPMLASAVYIFAWWHFALSNLVLALAGTTVLIFVTSHLVSDVLFSQKQVADNILPDYLRLFAYLPIIAEFIFITVFYPHLLPQWTYIVIMVVLWLAIFMINPLSKLKVMHNFEYIQTGDLISSMYDTLILAPLQIMGRILRLTIDVVFLERTVISSIKSAIRFMIFIFRRLHANSVLCSTVFMLLSIAIMVAAYYHGAVR